MVYQPDHLDGNVSWKPAHCHRLQVLGIPIQARAAEDIVKVLKIYYFIQERIQNTKSWSHSQDRIFVPTCVSRYFPAVCSSAQCGGTSRPCLWRDCIRNGTEQCLE